MLLEQERKDVVEYCNKMINTGLTKGTGGNISIFQPEKKLVAISPSGIEYNQLQPSDVTVVDLDGNIVDGDKKPSSEIAMHLIYYNRREEIQASPRTHRSLATTLRWSRKERSAVSCSVGPWASCARCAE